LGLFALRSKRQVLPSGKKKGGKKVAKKKSFAPWEGTEPLQCWPAGDPAQSPSSFLYLMEKEKYGRRRKEEGKGGEKELRKEKKKKNSQRGTSNVPSTPRVSSRKGAVASWTATTCPDTNWGGQPFNTKERKRRNLGEEKRTPHRCLPSALRSLPKVLTGLRPGQQKIVKIIEG